MVVRFYDRHAREYDTWYDTRQCHAENQVISEALNRERLGTVVDIGCGTGLAYELMEWPYLHTAHYVGVDPSEGMLRRAEAKHGTGEGSTTAHWVRGQGLQVLAGMRGVDMVCSLFAFQWIPDPERVLMRARHALRPGGRLVVVSARRRRDPAHPLSSRYRAKDWRYLLRAWDDVTIRPLTPVRWLTRLVPAACRLPGPVDMGQYLIVEARRRGGSEGGREGGAETAQELASPLAREGQESAQDRRRGYG